MASPAARRLARVRASLGEHDLEGLLVSHRANVRYLTGFSGSSGWLILDDARALFITDGRYETQAAEELPDDAGFELVVLRNGALAGLVEQAARSFAGRRIGFESAYLSFREWARLAEDGVAVDWKPVSGIVEGQRAAKDADEVTAIRRAGAIAARALTEMLSVIEPGVRESEIAAQLEYGMRRLGAEGAAFETIVASGPRTALPHAATGEREIRDGDLLLIDFGARWQGYNSDMTRTFVVGVPNPRQQEVYDLVLAAQEAAGAALREGVSGQTVDAAARAVFAAAGVEERFPHSTGHGLGLEVHEGPRLARRSEELLRPAMVVTVEPGLYFPGWGGVRIEDDLLVTPDGSEALVRLDKSRLGSLPL